MRRSPVWPLSWSEGSRVHDLWQLGAVECPLRPCPSPSPLLHPLPVNPVCVYACATASPPPRSSGGRSLKSQCTRHSPALVLCCATLHLPSRTLQDLGLGALVPSTLPVSLRKDGMDSRDARAQERATRARSLSILASTILCPRSTDSLPASLVEKQVRPLPNSLVG